MNNADKRYLHPLKGSVNRPKFAVIDIESKDGESQNAGFTRPFLVGFYEGNSYLAFTGPNCVENCVEYILDRRNDGMIYYAHNGGSFDWLHFLPRLRHKNLELMVIASSIQLMRVKSDDKKKGFTFLDSLKLAPLSLDKFCKAMNVAEKKQKDFDLNLHEDNPLWQVYNRLDCVALYDSLVKFYDVVESIGGEVGITTASTAMKTYRRRYQKEPIYRHVKHHDFFRESYYGGRVERFTESGTNLLYYDINSSYPASMLEPMPVGELSTVIGRPSLQKTAGSCGFVKASVYVPEGTYIPVLPIRLGGKLVFPTGHFNGIWTNIELDAAEKAGATVTYHESIWIKAKPIFGEMITRLYEMRDVSKPDYDKGRSLIAKLLCNSLYGKFGMSHEREKIFYLGDTLGLNDIPEGAIASRPNDPDNVVWYYDDEVDAPYIIPQISAWITALSRLRLYNIMLESHANGTLSYCDTDAVIGTANLNHLCGSGLGLLKDEGLSIAKEYGDKFAPNYNGVFIQPKLYALSATHYTDGSPINGQFQIGDKMIDKIELYKKVVMKGYKHRNWKEFENVRAGNVVSFQTLEKIGSLARIDFKRGPLMRAVTKQIQEKDTKRVFDSNGNSKPVHICETHSWVKRSKKSLNKFCDVCGFIA